jgi:hypothetical protein
VNVHRRTCAHCGTGPDALNPASIACCWNPTHRHPEEFAWLLAKVRAETLADVGGAR